MANGFGVLTDKEKQTLRLIVRGHDAKSAARHLDLSVHTINERLRDARRKLAVSSSREAARLLLEHEGATPELLGDTRLGEAPAVPMADRENGPTDGPGRPPRSVRLVIGALVMSLAFALLALVAHPQLSSPDTATPRAAEASDVAVEAAARGWLALVDAGRWEDSWAATAASFRSLNTSAAWAAASEKVRAPLGAMRSRTFLSHQSLPAPPHGYEVVKFRTDYANRQGVTETVSLDREGGEWRVVGIYVE